MQPQNEKFSAEEQQSMAAHLASTRELMDRVAGCLKSRLPEEQLVVMRAEEVLAALQRLEWQLERSLGQCDTVNCATIRNGAQR